jgi:SAM-dependent methyltransferase
VAWLVNPNRTAVPVERGRAFVQPSGKFAATLYDAIINLRHTQMLSMAGRPRPRCPWQEKIMAAEPDALAQFRENYVENMETMFAAVSDLYARYWHDFFHFAIFEGDESWDQAIEQTHRRYLRDLRIDGARSALDLACGRGGFAHEMARSTSGSVLGIDIARAQLRHADRYRRSNLRFAHHDVMRVHELGQSFDAISFIDAECYLPDKGLAVRRIADVLDPGGRLLLVAWCRREGLTALQQELVLHPFMRYWGVPGLETPTDYRNHFAAAGLRLIDHEDLNDKVRRNWDLGYERAIEGIRELSLADAAGLLWKRWETGADGLRLIKEQFAAALYIKAGFDSGFLRYVVFVAEKP